jgi:hypothetical protein
VAFIADDSAPRSDETRWLLVDTMSEDEDGEEGDDDDDDDDDDNDGGGSEILG